MSIHTVGGSDTRFQDSMLDAPIFLTDEQKRNAALYVCEKAEDADDARDLLEALGLA